MKKRGAIKRKGTKLAVSDSWALLIIDNEPIRCRALRDYHSAENGIARIREQIETFQTRDLPAFHRWEARLFGALLTGIRELGSKLSEKQAMLNAVDERAYWDGCSRRIAYRRVMADRNRPQRVDDEDFDGNAGDAFDTGDGESRMFGDSDLPPGFDMDAYQRSSKADKARFRDFYESVSELFETMTGQPAPDFDEVIARERSARQNQRPGNEQRAPAAPDRPRATPEDDAIKVLYRKLARQLHPDGNPNHGIHERELWHEVQEAYESRDLERMESVAGRVEIGLNGVSVRFPISILRRMTSDLNRILNSLRQQAKKTRLHQAWNFASRTEELPRMEKQYRQELDAQKSRLAFDLAGVEAILDNLESGGGKPRKKPPSRRPADGGLGQATFF